MKKISKTRFTSNGYISRVELKNEAKKLSQLEQVILFEHLLEKKTITQLVEECGVPRITLKRLKKQLLQKLRNVMEK